MSKILIHIVSHHASDYGQHPIKRPYSVVGALLASFRPSSDINCEWMQTPVEEYGLQEACHKLAPLGRTFNLLSRGTAPFQVARLKDMHLPAFHSHTARRFERTESIWSKRCHTGLQVWTFSSRNVFGNSATGACRNADEVYVESSHVSWCK